jgi:hypothetical protein
MFHFYIMCSTLTNWPTRDGPPLLADRRQAQRVALA